MASPYSSIELKIDTSDIDSILRLFCNNYYCKNNMINLNSSANNNCNLKYICLDSDGKCMMFVKKEE